MSQASSSAQSRPVIAVLAFAHISPFHLAVPCVVFGEAHPGAPAFELRVCALERGPFLTTAGFTMQAEYDLDALAMSDTIIVPSWRDVAETPPAPILAALRVAHARGARVVGLCLGAYVLAAAGLLDGRKATTHWAYASDFARRYPEIAVDADVLYIDQGDMLTSAGATAGLDCCLHLLRREYGAEVASCVARHLVTAPHRQGGQAQFIENVLPLTTRDAGMASLLDWVRANLTLPHSLDSLAEKARMNRRTFTRHFRKQTGTTVGQWLQSERLALSQRLLERTGQSVEIIAGLTGFGSAVSLRKHFRTAFGVSPSVWRQSFKGGAQTNSV